MDPGGYFCIFWLVAWLPVWTYWTKKFWASRHVKVIAHRSPILVVINDIVLACFAILLCIQQIVGINYPCLLSLWSGFLGILLVCNIYIWRCWTLFFSYNLAKTRAQLMSPPIGNKTRTCYRRQFTHLHYISTPFLVRFFGTLTLVLIFPCAFVTAKYYSEVSGTPFSRQSSCDKRQARDVFIGYGVVYVILFSICILLVHTTEENYKIKDELKWIFCVSLIFIPWSFFQFGWGWDKIVAFNNDTFPLSTATLLLGCFLVLYTSTILPCKWLKAPVHHGIIPGENSKAFQTLEGVLGHVTAREHFREFLIKELIGVNLLCFYKEIEEFKELHTKKDLIAIREKAKKINESYIQVNSDNNPLTFECKNWQTICMDLNFQLSVLQGEDSFLAEQDNLFDKALDYVREKLRDLWMRYHESEFYEKFAEKMDYHAAIETNLVLIHETPNQNQTQERKMLDGGT